jgi:hypothetical protein
MKRKVCQGVVVLTGERVVVVQVSGGFHNTTTQHNKFYRTTAPDERPVFETSDGREADCTNHKQVTDPAKYKWMIRDRDGIWKVLTASTLGDD